MRDRIREELLRVEEQHGVVILYACESGSRAWGFESADSDFDARFVYCHPPDWYLSIDVENRRDVIERPIDAGLDLNGWDLRKALRLLHKSNPPLLEWLRSPIVYHEDQYSVALLRSLAERFAARAGIWHYWHMAKGNYRDYLQGEAVWTKKYLYVVRPLLCARWVLAHGTPPPVAMDELVAATVRMTELREAIDALVARKRAGEELATGPRDVILDTFIAAELQRVEQAAMGVPSAGGPEMADLNAAFRRILVDTWGTVGGLEER